MSKARFLATLLLLGIGVGVLGAGDAIGQGQTPPTIVWEELFRTTTPPARWGGEIVYDECRRQFVLFGGAPRADGGFDNLLNDTWVFTAADTWVLKQPRRKPPARRDFGMVSDRARQRVLLFGGLNGLTPEGVPNALGDTWEWTGRKWRQVNPTTSPPPRHAPLMAYDAASERVVLFGGRTERNVDLADTWEWDGRAWHQRFPVISPPARRAGRMTFDYATGKVVLFGGFSNSRGFLNDTWEWDGENWSLRIPTNNPGPRELHGQTYSARHRVLVLFGGGVGDATPPLGDTWVWTGSDWVEPNQSPPPPSRTRFQMAYGGERILIFGGIAFTPYAGDVYDDTWVGR